MLLQGWQVDSSSSSTGYAAALVILFMVPSDCVELVFG
jgi:hypothetical protein